MINASLESCLAFVHSQTAPAAKAADDQSVRRAVTISRQVGCSAENIANRLASILDQRAPRPGVAWTVFDRELMARVLADHNLPSYLEKFLPEDRISGIEDTLADIFSVHPSAETMVQLTAETMLKLAGIGNVILIGRGGNIITSRIPHMLNVRLVAPLDVRIQRVCRDMGKTAAEARRFCLDEEAARARYLKTYFSANIDDPLKYHMVINTGQMDDDSVARLIAEALLQVA